LSAYRLAVQAEHQLPSEPELQRLVSQISTKPMVTTEPSGATIRVRPYLERQAPWEHVGETPIRDVRLPLADMQWKVEKAGFVPLLRAGWPARYEERTGTIVPETYSLRLVPAGSEPADMVRVDGTDEVPEFLVDRTEVTNRQFKAFVDAGGYRDQKYWKHEFQRDGRVLPWPEAMRAFVDRTGRPGPATWEAGDFAEGKGDFPVGGVSWYEAAAFAEFAGKSLPTLEHWWAQGRCLRGGAWNDQTYMFDAVTQAPAFDRSETNGFRSVRYLEGKTPHEKLFAPYGSAAVRDFTKEKPVSDEVFAAYRRLFDYDAHDLRAKVEARDETRPDWVRERVSFTAAYGDERVIAQLYLPRAGRPPYQVVLYFPGSDAIQAGPSDDVEQRFFFKLLLVHFLKAGRAVLYPVYKGTHERNGGKPDYYGALHDSGDPTQEYVDYQVTVVRDVRRSLDYLASRPDIDSHRVAYEGFSWGSYVAPIVLAAENRFAAAIVVLGGLDDVARPRPEVDLPNYAPRVKLPVLMLNGRYDLVFPLESSARPLFERLGTPPGDKVLRVYDSDHSIPWTELVRESLAWLDKYLGPVEPAAAAASQETTATPHH
jgi:cephalosporin-C deacetylase-like acetyl esterase